VFYGENKDSYWFCGLFWYHWWCFSSCTMMGTIIHAVKRGAKNGVTEGGPIMVHEEKHHQWCQKSPQNQ
jgi:hypothetical protein